VSEKRNIFLKQHHWGKKFLPIKKKMFFFPHNWKKILFPPTWHSEFSMCFALPLLPAPTPDLPVHEQ
jgi:hypothetical protein